MPMILNLYTVYCTSIAEWLTTLLWFYFCVQLQRFSFNSCPRNIRTWTFKVREMLNSCKVMTFTFFPHFESAKWHVHWVSISFHVPCVVSLFRWVFDYFHTVLHCLFYFCKTTKKKKRRKILRLMRGQNSLNIL